MPVFSSCDTERFSFGCRLESAPAVTVELPCRGERAAGILRSRLLPQNDSVYLLRFVIPSGSEGSRFGARFLAAPSQSLGSPPRNDREFSRDVIKIVTT